MDNIKNIVLGLIGTFLGILLLPELQLVADLIRGNLVASFTMWTNCAIIVFLAKQVLKQG